MLLPVTPRCSHWVAAPTPFEVNGNPARSFSLSVGGQIDIQLQVIGLEVHKPTLSGTTLKFLGVTAPGLRYPRA